MKSADFERGLRHGREGRHGHASGARRGCGRRWPLSLSETRRHVAGSDSLTLAVQSDHDHTNAQRGSAGCPELQAVVKASGAATKPIWWADRSSQVRLRGGPSPDSRTGLSPPASWVGRTSLDWRGVSRRWRRRRGSRSRGRRPGRRPIPRGAGSAGCSSSARRGRRSTRCRSRPASRTGRARSRCCRDG
jgi:hypothetical protein